MKNFVFYLMCTLQMYQSGLGQDFEGQYNDFLAEDEKEVFTTYHYVESKKKDGSIVYRQFFPETRQLTHLRTFTSNKKKKHGHFAMWYDDGSLKEEGQFVMNKKEGLWYQKGIGKGIYKDDKREGLWEDFYPNGQIKSKSFYVNGKNDGPFVNYDSLGQIMSEGIFKADTVFSKTTHMEYETFQKVEEMPYLSSCEQNDKELQKKCSDEKLLHHIHNSLKYPSDAREYGVEGQAIIQFVVNKEGQIEDIKVLQGLCQSIKDHVVKVVMAMPKWNAGKSDGINVRVLYTLPIKFKLEG